MAFKTAEWPTNLVAISLGNAKLQSEPVPLG